MQYEIAVLYHPDLEVDLSKAEQKVTKIITDNGGKMASEDNWGKRKLAYTIKKVDHAVYVFYTVEMPGEGVRKVESILNITDEVLRFLITRVDHKTLAKASAARAEKAEKAAARGDRAGDDEKPQRGEE